MPFAEADAAPVNLLSGAGIEYVVNPTGRKLKEDELAELLVDFDGLIAGTEPITAKVIARAERLKIIARVGVGLDSVDLHAARQRGIRVSYTPEAPVKAVSDLTIGLMISLLRQSHVSNMELHGGRWQRRFGRRLGAVTVGLIGAGRIGSDVLALLQGFGCRIMVNDIRPNRALEKSFRFEWAEKEDIYREADVISIHVPLTSMTRDMITGVELQKMKPDAALINTSRGGIVREADLCAILQSGHLGGAAFDVFEQEPYDGALCGIGRCLLTAHIGSMSIDCRSRMELEATQETVRFLTGQPLESEVPDEEYENQRT